MMKNKLFMLMALVLIVGTFQFCSAEITFWQSLSKNNITSTTNIHGAYFFDDTSETNVGKNRPITLDIQYLIQALPYDLGSGNFVDWCNLTTIHYTNIYDSQGFSINTSSEVTNSLYFSSMGLTTGIIEEKMYSSDYLFVDMTCHYTNPSTLYFDNIPVGRFQAYVPSFQCSQCSKYTLEELSHATETNFEIAQSQTTIYSSLGSIVDWNYKFWLYGSWFIKIAMLILAIGLIFSTGYYFYKFFKDIGDLIR